MGDDEDVLPGGRLAVPAVGQVEQPPSDDHRRRVAVLAADTDVVACLAPG
jgi:hypothetical protein